MFSMTTIELSTSMPTPSARPDRLIMFRVTPEKYISTTANIRLMGMLNATTPVGRRSFRNSASTRMASSAPQARFEITVFTVILM